LILQKLRQQTRAHHEALERALGLTERVLTAEEYMALLQRFYGFYHPLEACLRSLEFLDGIGLDVDARCKAHLLYADLEALGASDMEILALPLCARLPPLETLPQALGCMYVLEGATLGGQVLVRTLGRSAAQGGRFFASYGPAVAAMWTAFREVVRRNSVSGEVEESMVNSARATFDALHRWVSGKAQ